MGWLWGPNAAILAAFGAFIGHLFPVWLKFRGGKGVATAAGALFMVAPFALLCAGLVFVIIVALTRYVSLGSLTAAVLIPFFLWLQKWLIQPAADIRPPLTAAVIAALLIIFAHRGNIARLVNRTEPKFR
jgi:glycerol-3-phosphate acyltransferase PlsY